jgi:hypothetical protein
MTIPNQISLRLNTPAMLYLSQCVVDAFSPGIAFISPSEATVLQRAHCSAHKVHCSLNMTRRALPSFGYYRFFGYFG